MPDLINPKHRQLFDRIAKARGITGADLSTSDPVTGFPPAISNALRMGEGSPMQLIGDIPRERQEIENIPDLSLLDAALYHEVRMWNEPPPHILGFEEQASYRLARFVLGMAGMDGPGTEPAVEVLQARIRGAIDAPIMRYQLGVSGDEYPYSEAVFVSEVKRRMTGDINEARIGKVYRAVEPFLEKVCDIVAHEDMEGFTFKQFLLHEPTPQQAPPDQGRTGTDRGPLEQARRIMNVARHLLTGGHGPEDQSRRLSPPQRDRSGDGTPGGGGLG